MSWDLHPSRPLKGGCCPLWRRALSRMHRGLRGGGWPRGLLKCTLSSPEPRALLTYLVICAWLCRPPFTLLSGPCTPERPPGPWAAAKVAAPPLRALGLTAPATVTPGPGSGWSLTPRIGRGHENRKPGLLTHFSHPHPCSHSFSFLEAAGARRRQTGAGFWVWFLGKLSHFLSLFRAAEWEGSRSEQW